MAPGWVQQNIQVPEDFRALFRDEASRRGHSSVKTLGTAGLGLLMGMPADVRTAMFIWVQGRISQDGPDLDPREIYETLVSFADAHREDDEHALTIALTNALRGNVTLPPTESKGNN